ncbi:hypothetical protein ACKKBG_A20630 [Auxenochlorella protothecoides x Auxenochlorella symbiontica]
MLELQHVHGPVHGATDPRHGQSFVRHGCARPGHGRAHAMPRFANVWRRGASAPRYRALRQDTSAPGPKLEPFVVQNSAAQRAVTFQRQGTLACGAGLLVLPLPKDRLEDAATLLNDSFAESLGYISMYRSYLQSQIRQYLRQHLPLLPKTVILAAFRVGDEQGAELAVEGSGDAEGEEEHLDHEPECELVGIVELSFSASTRTKALTLNPPPLDLRRCPHCRRRSTPTCPTWPSARPCGGRASAASSCLRRRSWPRQWATPMSTSIPGWTMRWGCACTAAPGTRQCPRILAWCGSSAWTRDTS